MYFPKLKVLILVKWES